MDGATPPPPRSRRALLWTSTSYFGEGLPWSFLHQMATEFLTAIGASNTQIGSTSLLHLAVTFKFAWSPIVDLYGRLRAWVVALEIMLGLGMMVVAALASPGALPLFWMLLSVLAVFHATHDIACDGLYLKALDRPGQALYSGVRTAAFRAAMLVGSSLLVVLAGKTSWLVGFGSCGVLMVAVGLLNGGVLPRPASDLGGGELRVRAAGQPGQAKAVFGQSFRSFLAQPHAPLVLSFMFLYRLGDIMMFAMSKPLLRDIGVDTAHRGMLNGLGISSFIVASLLGGATIARVGFHRCLVPMTYLQNLAIPLYIVLAVFAPPFPVVIAIVIIEQFASGIGNASHVVFLMRRSRAIFSASHYAFATAIVSLGSTLSGYLSGPLNTRVGHPWFFTCAFLASVPALILVWFVPRQPVEAETPAVAAAPAPASAPPSAPSSTDDR
ncbi:MAG TPA: MFS transporter [Polyangia bacterium]|jgi:PAT family beta-lactamase induction signal transducer AmpG|nr:MFS transporter [Polyangia bacterium]